MTASELQAMLADALAQPDGEPRLSSGLLPRLLRQTYGDDAGLIRDKLTRLATQCDLFRRLYGDGPVSMLRAPARINILGEHVDYVSYLPTASLPFGSREHDMVILFRAADSGQVRGASTLDVYPPFSFTLGEGPLVSGQRSDKDEWTAYLYGRPAPAPHWGNYVKGAVFFARLKYGEMVGRGFDFVIDSGIPPGGGSSSSSALVVLAGAAIRRVNQIEEELNELAQGSAQAEWYVGTRGGAMDHTTICLAEPDTAVHLLYAEGRADLVPLPGGHFRWVTFFSHPADKGREVMLEYNERAAVSRILIPAIIANWARHEAAFRELWDGAVQSVRSGPWGMLTELEKALGELPTSITLAEMEHQYPDAFQECQRAFPALVQERRDHPLKLRDRALHHVGEVRRVEAAVRALRQASEDRIGQAMMVDQTMRQLGQLLDASHASLRDLYAVSTPEVDHLVEVIHSDSQVYGARLMGGGFGGNVLTLTMAANVPRLIDRVQSEFYGPRGRDGRREGAVMVSTPGQGLSALDPEQFSAA